eukprot:6212124-Pleurochrysis_carterae.AAC.1
MELKLVSPTPTGQAPVPAAGPLFAFASTKPRLLSDILGHPPDYAGAQYRDALRRGHTVTPFIVEVLGGFAAHARLLLRGPALRREARFVPDPLSATTSASSFVAYYSQSVSIALHTAIARQILVFAQYGPAARRGAPTERPSAAYPPPSELTMAFSSSGELVITPVLPFASSARCFITPLLAIPAILPI